MSNTVVTTRQKDKMWIINIIGILFFVGLALWSYARITRFETDGGFLSLPKPLKLLYEVIGKWGVVGFWMLLVLYNVVKGIRTAVKENKQV